MEQKKRILIVDPIHNYALEELKKRFDVIYNLHLYLFLESQRSKCWIFLHNRIRFCHRWRLPTPFTMHGATFRYCTCAPILVDLYVFIHRLLVFGFKCMRLFAIHLALLWVGLKKWGNFDHFNWRKGKCEPWVNENPKLGSEKLFHSLLPPVWIPFWCFTVAVPLYRDLLPRDPLTSFSIFPQLIFPSEPASAACPAQLQMGRWVAEICWNL